jgi:glycosyltransferase involved in cell wall biosynthesis
MSIACPRHVLVIHYHFPPLGGAGVQRVLKFVKYLPQLGWDVTVLTTSSRSYPVTDDSLLADVPAEVRVARTTTELPAITLRRWLLNPAQRLRMSGLIEYVGWPDDTSGWLPFAAADGVRLARRLKPDVVFSSSYPYSAHIAARAVSRACGIPWVADFRDPWTRGPHSDPSRLLTRVNRRAERWFVRAADRVTVVDDSVELDGLDADDPRRVVIHNGVDEADIDLAADVHTPAPNRFSLTHVGSLYGWRDAAPVFASLSRLIERQEINRNQFEVSLVGNVWMGSRPIETNGVPVRTIGYVDHRRAVEEMRRATALLFYQPSEYPTSSGKIFEYLLSARPILCVARRQNLAYRLVEEFGAGAVAEPDDPGSIDRALASLYGSWRDGTLGISAEVRDRTLARFSRRVLAERLASVLDDAVRAKAATGWTSNGRETDQVP